MRSMRYVSPNKPDPHQVVARERLLTRPPLRSGADVMAWLMEMGTGKSYVILDEWQQRVAAGDLENLLVVAPAGSYRNWYEDKSDLQRSELNAHLDPELLRRLIVAPWVTGGGAATRDRIAFALRTRGRPRAMFVNVEALSTVKKAREAVAEFVASGPTMFAVDESTTIKNQGAERTKQIVQLGAGAAARRIATGLVTPRSPLDLYTQFEFLDKGILRQPNYWNFRARYAITKKTDFGGRLRRKIDIVVGYRNVQELQHLIAPYSYRVLKKDCLDIKPKQYVIRDVELTDEQRRLYGEMSEYATAAVGDEAHVTASSVITQMIRLHQIVCGHVVDETGVIRDVKSNRPRAVLDLLNEHGGKAIVWCTYRHELDKLSRVVQKEFGRPGRERLCVAEFHGGNTGTRAEDERRFLGDPECRWMFATQAAGGRGNTWNVADLSAYAANTHDLELRSQSEDRNHRRGQNSSVMYADLMARGTVEERIVKALRKKIDMATLITGENYREWLI